MTSKAMSTLYTEEVYRHLKPWHSNWPLSTEIRLGDYGFMRGRRFERLGNISEYGIDQVSDRSAETENHESFSSDGKTHVDLQSRGEASNQPVAVARAAAHISFLGKGAVFFNLAGCRYKSVEGKAALEKPLIELGDQWNRRWVVVTDLVQPRSTTIAIASEATGKLVIEADAKVDEIDFADASIKFTATQKQGVGYNFLSEEHSIPLLAFCALRRRFVAPWRSEFRTYSGGGIEACESEDEVSQHEGEPADWQFVQLR